MVRPELEREISVNLPVATKITHNMADIKEFAIKLKEFYSNLIFTDEDAKSAKDERAKLNSFKRKVTDLRKSKIDEIKVALGIDDFEKECKETEKLIDETADFVDAQVKIFEEKEWNLKKEEIEKLLTDLKIDIIWDDKWKNKGYTLDTISKDIEVQVMAYEEDQKTIEKEINVIKRMTSEEKYIERYIHTRDLTGVLDDIERDKKTIEPIKEGIKQVVDGITVKLSAENTAYGYTFYGTKDQIESLKKYARETLWMEVE